MRPARRRRGYNITLPSAMRGVRHGLLLVVCLLAALGAAAAPDCDAWRAALDGRIRAAGADDPRYHRLGGTRWLRTDRFLHGAWRRARDAGDPARARAVLERMAALDAGILAQEQSSVAPPAGPAPDAGACRGAALDEMLRAPPADALRPPDEYLRWRRVIGLYPLLVPFLRAGVTRWQDEERAAHAEGPPPPAVRYVPPSDAGAFGAPDAVARALREAAAAHPLGWPLPPAPALAELALRFAPELAAPTDAAHDLPGRLTGSGGRPRVDPGAPTADWHARLVHWDDRVLLQLVYTFWFTERPKGWLLDPYGGAVDGIVWRVTLAEDGRPLLWDSVHPCGCFHTVFLPEGRQLALRRTEPPRAERPLVFTAPSSSARVRLAYAPDTHLVRHATAVAEPPVSTTVPVRAYALRPEEELHRGPERAPYGPHGLLAGTGRLERFFLWPSGIRSPGAMRARGRRATAFVGHRHFDAAELLDGLLRVRVPGEAARFRRRASDP